MNSDGSNDLSQNGESQNTNSSNSRGENASRAGSSRISLVDIVENLYFFRWFFFGTFIVALSFSIIYAIVASPVYVSDSLIQIEEKKNAGISALKDAQAPNTQPSLVGEMEIISSRRVMTEAIEALKTNINITVENRIPVVGRWLSRILDKDPDGLVIPLWDSSKYAWGGEEIKVAHFGVPKQFYGQPFFLHVDSSEDWSLSDQSGNLLLKGNGLERGAMSQNNEYVLAFDQIKARPGTIFKMTMYDVQSSIGGVLGGLTLGESKRGSNMIRLTYSSTNPNTAAQILSAIVNAYVGQNISHKSEEAQKSLEFLNSELPKLKMKLEADEESLISYRGQNMPFDIPGAIPALVTESSGVAKSRMELELKLREYQTRYQPDHPIIKGIQLQLSQLQSFMGQINQEISKLPQVQQDYIRKSLELAVNKQLYITLVNNAQQLQVSKAGTVGNIYVVDYAQVPNFPSRPKKPLIVAIGALAGVILGILVCQLLAFLSGIVRDPKNLEHATGTSILAILPVSSEQIEVINKSNDEAVFMLAQSHPSSIPVEALRALRTTTLFALSEKPRSKVILITSAVPAQGKSFISANLSYLLASTNKRVLLIEADVRKASLRRYIAFDKKGLGLTSILRDGHLAENLILRDVYPNMDFLPAGHSLKNPGDILSSDVMLELINTMADRYDYVVIDSPPLLPVNDARSLARAADVTLFVVRQEMSSISEVRESMHIFEKGGSKIDGIVFNGFVPSQIRYGYNYGYGYVSYGRYGRYGRYGEGYGRYKHDYKNYRYSDYGEKKDE